MSRCVTLLMASQFCFVYLLFILNCWNQLNYSIYTSLPQKTAFKKAISNSFSAILVAGTESLQIFNNWPQKNCLQDLAVCLFIFSFFFFLPLGFEPPQTSEILYKNFSTSGPRTPICFGADDSLVSSCSHQAALSPAVLQNCPVFLEHYM